MRRDFTSAVAIIAATILAGMLLIAMFASDAQGAANNKGTKFPDGTGMFSMADAKCDLYEKQLANAKARYGEVPFMTYLFGTRKWVLVYSYKTQTFSLMFEARSKEGQDLLCVRLFGKDMKPYVKPVLPHNRKS